MKPKTTGASRGTQKLNHFQKEGPNWVLIAGGALLSTLSIRLACKLKQAFETKQTNSAKYPMKENGNSSVKRRQTACRLHSNLYCFDQGEDGCYHCLTGNPADVGDNKHTPASPVSKEVDLSLSLVKTTTAESLRDNDGVMWASSPDRLELPPKPFHHSNCSDSPCVSESGSDIFSKREVIQKLRQQVKRREDMIMEMQAQIVDLQNSLSIQLTHTAHLQSQLESVNADLFDSEREIQRLRKAIADHCVAGVGAQEKSPAARNWRPEATNGHTNGYANGTNDLDLHCVHMEAPRSDNQKVEMLKREVGELKEVIEGKDFLLLSYKEQKAELSSKVKELQLKISNQVPNIL